MPSDYRKNLPPLPTFRCPICGGTGANPDKLRAIANSRASMDRPTADLKLASCLHCGGTGKVETAPAVEKPNG